MTSDLKLSYLGFDTPLLPRLSPFNIVYYSSLLFGPFLFVLKRVYTLSAFPFVKPAFLARPGRHLPVFSNFASAPTFFFTSRLALISMTVKSRQILSVDSPEI
jgi:hypothetical protein